jgi:2-oxoglutarate ferredoxin oxidoreductase subunit gamma
VFDGRRDPVRIRLTGRGGQGIMLAGAILAEAAMEDGREVTETQEYGPEARLGATKAEVVIGSRPIAFPAVDVPDVLLCLSRDGFKRYGHIIAPDGLRIVEATIEEADEPGLLSLPLKERAREAGDEVAMNIVGLGALAALTGVVGAASLERAVRSRVKAEFLEVNLKALAAGLALGRAAGVTAKAAF